MNTPDMGLVVVAVAVVGAVPVVTALRGLLLEITAAAAVGVGVRTQPQATAAMPQTASLSFSMTPPLKLFF
jgi:hypothetical protein